MTNYEQWGSRRWCFVFFGKATIHKNGYYFYLFLVSWISVWNLKDPQTNKLWKANQKNHTHDYLTIWWWITPKTSIKTLLKIWWFGTAIEMCWKLLKMGYSNSSISKYSAEILMAGVLGSPLSSALSSRPGCPQKGHNVFSELFQGLET